MRKIPVQLKHRFSKFLLRVCSLQQYGHPVYSSGHPWVIPVVFTVLGASESSLANNSRREGLISQQSSVSHVLGLHAQATISGYLSLPCLGILVDLRLSLIKFRLALNSLCRQSWPGVLDPSDTPEALRSQWTNHIQSSVIMLILFITALKENVHLADRHLGWAGKIVTSQKLASLGSTRIFFHIL